jgi:hypothetical protein
MGHLAIISSICYHQGVDVLDFLVTSRARRALLEALLAGELKGVRERSRSSGACSTEHG